MPLLLIALLTCVASAQTPGEALFSRHCSFCHGANGRGGERGPAITDRGLRQRTDLAEVIRTGIPAKGMPPVTLDDASVAGLISYLRSLEPSAPAPAGRTAISIDGPSPGQIIRPVEGTWPTYHGNVSANRHSPLDGINAGNVDRLAPAWLFSITGAPRLQVTPVVYGDVMYVTAPNEVYAIRADNGREIWRFRRLRTKGMAGDAASGINRGVAILGHRLFTVTDNAHLLALDRATGRLLWDVETADYRENYGATSAPLIAGELVINGMSGGDEGARGFLDAYDPATGRRVWRFWTVPAPGEPGSETWKGDDWKHGCAATWLTGTYDPSQDLVIWPTGNPCPDYNGDGRQGDNLYSNSVIAIDAKSGKLRWHFQFTPHDLWDWDSTETMMAVDRGGKKLLLHADRNGFFYVLDRTDGTLIHAKPFVRQLTWASGVDSKTGRPLRKPEAEPTPTGAKACPAVEGATNWFSTAFNPVTGLYYLQALEKCTIYTKKPAEWKAGESHYGGDTRRVPGEQGRKFLRAIDITTGELRWELPQDGHGNTWGGVLSTAGGLVFFGHDNGDFAAASAGSGQLLWSFPANQSWKSSPMTYLAGGRQYVATAAGSNIVAFALK
jgi:alcohol dehydrogenase (cytochrome c)